MPGRGVPGRTRLRRHGRGVRRKVLPDVLSIGKIGLNGEGYYVAAVADGVDEYYRGVGEAPGRWSGAASGHLGLNGEVAPTELHAVWAGLAPSTGEPLGRFAGRTVAGFDLCFRAPKSVSVLSGLGDVDTAAAVRGAHDVSVAAAFGYVERAAARSRVGRNGVTQIEVNGLVAARFRHRTSRAGDPHLHTHLLVANMAQGADGKWRTLDGRVVYQHAKTAGYLYEAHLRHELTARLGVEWEPVTNGIADLSGIASEVLDHFSTRRKQIDEHLDEVGFRSARAAELAALETRTPKDRSLDGASMRQKWDAKAAEIGFDPRSLAEVVGRVPPHRPAAPGVLFADLLSGEGLTQHASSFVRRDLLRAIAERLPAGTPVADVEQLADRFLDLPQVVRLVETHGPGLLSSNVIRRADGTIVAGGVDEARWSTAELVGIEHRIVEQALDRAGEGTGLVQGAVVADVLARRPTLAAERAEMVANLTGSGNGLDVVSAAAGTGKTYTLDAAREAWQGAGYQVIGAALAGRAAQELQSSAAIKSSTLAMLGIDLDAGRVRFDGRTVVVIDEAGMAGTRNLAPILEVADRAGAKVVLVGDPHQLPEIDAGGVLTGLSQRLDPVELVENRRQRARWERDALAELRSGDVDAAFAAYDRQGRVVTAPTAIDVRQAMVADWWSHRLAGDTAALLAVRRSDVDDLNGRARAYLQRAGDVSGPELVIDERPYQASDDIVCLRNDRRLGVCNGTRATIESVDPDARTLTVRADNRRFALPASYLDDRNVAHGYATTIHKAQGATFDRGLLLGTDELYRERGYVGMSRGRETNHLYVVGAAETDDAAGHGPPPRIGDTADAVQAALTQETDQRLAIDTGDPLALWPLGDLVAEKHRLHRLLAECPDDRRHDITALTERRAEVAEQIEPLASRYNDLADRRLRGPGTRSEMGELREQIGERTARLHRITGELHTAEQTVKEWERFEAEHATHSARLGAVQAEIDRHIAQRVDQHLADPTEYHLAILGPVPADPDHQTIWKRGAAILATHHLGADADPTGDRRSSLLGSRREAAEMRARLETVAIPQLPQPAGLERDSGVGLDLFG